MTEHISTYYVLKWLFSFVFLLEESGTSNASISLPICLVSLNSDLINKGVVFLKKQIRDPGGPVVKTPAL